MPRGRRKPQRGQSALAFECEPRLRKRLRDRLARLRGQIEALRRMVDENPDCELLVQQLSAARAALDSVAAEVVAELARLTASIEDPQQRQQAANRVAQLLRRYR